MAAGDLVETTQIFDIRGSSGRSHVSADWQSRSGGNSIKKTPALTEAVGQEAGSVSEELRLWRENFTLKDAVAELNADHRDKQFTVVVSSSGGLLDTFAPIWGCENNTAQARMWGKFTGCTNLGGVFGPAVLKAERPVYIKSGAPCPNFALSGNGLGADGKTG